MSTERDIARQKDFLYQFNIEDVPPNPSFHVRLRHQPLPVSHDEVEGECLELALNILNKRDCPVILDSAIARATTNKVLDECANTDETAAAKEYSRKALDERVRKALAEVCECWKLDFPENLKKEAVAIVSGYGIQNFRRKMEDRHQVFCNLNLLDDISDMSNIQFYSVFDGHSGVEAAEYATKHFHLKMLRNTNFPTNIPLCLEGAMKEVDDSFCEKAKAGKNIRSGTTALVAVVYENILHLAWLGDGQVVIVKDGRATKLIVPHKPEHEDEKRRIEEAGGEVIEFGGLRVDGKLNVSRAIGDLDYKPYVCADADMLSLALNEDDEYICLASDGFWDVYKPHEVPRLVAEYIAKTGTEKLDEISKFMCQRASDRRSQDNITVIMVFLRDVNYINIEGPLRGFGPFVINTNMTEEPQPNAENTDDDVAAASNKVLEAAEEKTYVVAPGTQPAINRRGSIIDTLSAWRETWQYKVFGGTTPAVASNNAVPETAEENVTEVAPSTQVALATASDDAGDANNGDRASIRGTMISWRDRVFGGQCCIS